LVFFGFVWFGFDEGVVEATSWFFLALSLGFDVGVVEATSWFFWALYGFSFFGLAQKFEYKFLGGWIFLFF